MPAKDTKFETLTKQFLRAGGFKGRVDFEKNIIYGVILAEVGIFKTRRGQFTAQSLDSIVEAATKLSSPLQCQWKHKSGIQNYLGRYQNIVIDGDKVRGDLHMSKAALTMNVSGGTPLGEFVMKLADEDPKALQTSFVLSGRIYAALNDDGTPKLDPNTGEPEPGVWIPKTLFSSDIVKSGDAIRSGFLSDETDSFSSEAVSEILDAVLQGDARDDVDVSDYSFLDQSFLDRYLTSRFGEKIPMTKSPADPAPVQSISLSDEDKTSIVDLVVAKLSSTLEPMVKASQSVLASEKLRASEDRSTKIISLCTDMGVPEQAAALISIAELSVGDVRAKLWNKFVEKSKSNDDPEQNPGGAGGAGSKLTAEQLAGKEYDAAAEVYAEMGIDRSDYIKGQLSAEKDDKKAVNPLVSDL